MKYVSFLMGGLWQMNRNMAVASTIKKASKNYQSFSFHISLIHLYYLWMSLLANNEIGGVI